MGSTLALFAYAAAFSLAYLSLTAATGALLLFGAVQVTMIAAGLVGGERLSASGMGYAVLYAALAGLTATTAATVQLSVPVITAVAGVSLLGESLSLRLVRASAAVLAGIALVILARRPSALSAGPSR